MNTYYVTMGLMYRHEAHPMIPAPLANPDGWLEVHAESESEAREIVQAVLGSHYAFLYREDNFTSRDKHHPLGCLGTLVHGVVRTDDDLYERAMKRIETLDAKTLASIIVGYDIDGAPQDVRARHMASAQRVLAWLPSRET